MKKKMFTRFLQTKRGEYPFMESVCIEDIPAKNLASARILLEDEETTLADFLTISHVRFGNRFHITVQAYGTTVGHAAGSRGTRIVGEFLDFDAMKVFEMAHKEARDIYMTDFVSVVLRSMEAALMEA